MNNIQNQYQPQEVSPPGETLRETLEYLKMSPLDLAKRIDISLPRLRKILVGKAPLTPEIAVKLEFILGVPAHFWNHREQHYHDYLLQRGSPPETAGKVWPRRSPPALVSLIPSHQHPG